MSDVAGRNSNIVSNIVRIDMGPVGYWKIDEGGNIEIIKDYSTSFFSNAKWSAVNGIWKDNRGSKDIDWTDTFLNFRHTIQDYIKVNQASQFNLHQAGGFTQSAWVKTTTLNNEQETYYGVVGYQGDNDITKRYPSIYITGEGKLHAGFGISNEWCNITTPNVVVEENVWSFISVAYSRTTSQYSVYKNGLPVGTYQPKMTNTYDCVGQYPYTIQQLNIGRVGDAYFNGNISDVKIYNYPRRPEDIKTDYEASRGSR